MHIEKILNLDMSKERDFFRNEVEVNDSTFHLWKEELQKELSTFWESMNR